MFYLMFLPAILVQLLLIRLLFNAKRHDKAMFRFCAFNSEMIAFLASPQGQGITNDEYIYSRWLIEINQVSIDKFNQLIRRPFSMAALLRNLRFVDNKLISSRMGIGATQNESLKALYHKMVDNFGQSVLAFNPLLRYKMVLVLLVLIGQALTKLGISKARYWTQEMSDRWSHISTEGEICY